MMLSSTFALNENRLNFNPPSQLHRRKKIFSYIKPPLKTQSGLVQHRIRLWFVSLTQSILVRSAII